MVASPVLLEFDKFCRNWGWYLAFGIGLIVLGTVAFFLVPAATLATVLFLGWLLVISGVIEAIHAFRMRGWGGVFLHVVAGILGVLVGLLVVTHPVAGALAWTLLFASFFTVIGIFRIVAAIKLKFPFWGWAVFDGVVTTLLGVVLWIDWPWSGLWFLGVALGISLILRGWSYVMLSLAARTLTTARGSGIRQAA